MWTKEECRAFFERILGLGLTDTEVTAIWDELNKNQLTPVSKHGGNNIGFTPQKLRSLITLATERTKSTLRDPRFKKVSEEIIPAIFFTLLLKYFGQGEHLIVSTDSADIALVDFNKENAGQVNRRVGALSVEALFITESAIFSASGASSAKKIADIIITRKFRKRYIPETVLLATLNAKVKNLSFEELSNLLSGHVGNPFPQIWIFTGLDTENCIIARLHPTLEIHHLHVARDLLSLMY